jgi:general secretion pathway protein D
MRFASRPPGRWMGFLCRGRVRIFREGRPRPTVQFVLLCLGLYIGLFYLPTVFRPAIAAAQEEPAAQPEEAPPAAQPQEVPAPQPEEAPPTIQPQEAPTVQPQEAPTVQSNPPPVSEKPKPTKERLITLDFNNVDLPVFVKFVSEIVGKNFIIDERVRGKVTIFSPSKISVDKVYQVFLSVLEIKGLAAVSTGEMIQVLPASDVPPERSINVYYLENANAEETAKLLTSLVTRSGAAAARPAAARRNVGRPPAGEFEGTVQIIPDKTTNALLITASEADFEMLKDVIKKLDVRRRQVYVEAVIMEVAEDKLKELGTELGAVAGYQSNNQKVTTYGGFNQAPEDIAALTSITGINIGVSTVNVKVLLKALQSTSDVNILSTPQILATNNQKAKIVVAQNVPFVTGNNQTIGGVTQTQINRQDVGVTLELTPEILEGDRVRMDIRQEISSLADTPQAVLIQLGPTTNKREASTTVVVSSDQTVVIGGLMRDDVTNSVSKIPLLGDIPLLGWFFKTHSNRSTKTNLLIFLTPHVVHDSQDLDELRQKKIDAMKQTVSEGTLKNTTLSNQFLNSINPPQDKR